MCFCNTYQYLMRKEISGSLFRETPPLYFGAPFVFQLWVMLSKDECYNQYPMKNSALYLYPPSHLSQTVIPTKNICYSHEKAVFYDTRPPIIAQGHDGRFLVLGMYTMYLSFAFTFCSYLDSHLERLSMLSLFIHPAFLSGISPIRLYTFEITPFRPILCCIPFVKNSILSFLGRPSFFLGDPPISFPTCIYHKKRAKKA